MISAPKKLSDIIVLLIAGIFVFLAVMDGFIFYYKYSHAVNLNSISTERNTRFYLDAYKMAFRESSNDISLSMTDSFDIRLFQKYMEDYGIYDSYLLKQDENGSMRIVATYDENLVGKELIMPDCGINNSSDILKFARNGFYFHQQILPENRVLACAFEPYNGYILGFRHTFSKNISGFDDPDFKEWFINNISLTLLSTFLGSLLGFGIFLLFLTRNLCLQRELTDIKNSSKEEIRKANNQLYFDSSTGLLNGKALERDVQMYKNPRILILDIDDFSRMNEYYGDDICASLIVEMSKVLSDFASENKMTAYRIEYDTFALLENFKLVVIERYEDLANNILERFKGRIVSIQNGMSSKDIEVHTTIGISLDDEYTISKAYIALKHAKKNHKDFACYFKGLGFSTDYGEQVYRSNLIKHAILNNEIIYFYQPIFDSNKDILRYEMLMRISSSNEPISPHIFLDAARKIKRYEDLEKSIISQCELDLKENHNKHISINLNVNDVYSQNISNQILKLISDREIAKRLTIELIMDTEITDFDRLLRFVAKLKNYGTRVAIDDFGTSTMCLADIIRLSPDIIKLDKSITRNVDTDESAKNTLGIIVKFANSAGIRVGAKHIHSKDIFEVCKSFGIDEYQGYYLGMSSSSMIANKYIAE